MNVWLARVIVRTSALLVPREQRARWKEEWAAEIDASRQSQKLEARSQKVDVLRRALGAPKDALAMRRLSRAGRAPRVRQLDQWLVDTRYTLRLLARSPGYVAVVVLGLGVGLTATITMYSAVNAVLHGDLPGIVDRDSLAIVDPWMDATDPRQARLSTMTQTDFELIQRHGPLIRDVAAQGDAQVTVHVGGDVDNVRAVFASANLFEMLGTRAVIGRLLGPADHRPDAASVVIGYRLWQGRFAGRADALGADVQVGNRRLRVVGVAPDRFNGIGASWQVEEFGRDTAQVWVPLTLARDWPGAFTYLRVAARLAPGVTRAQAKAELAPVERALEAAHSAPGRRVSLRLWDIVVGRTADDPLELSGIILAVLAFPLAVLAIGCANVANLRLARATARASEWAVRISLGASRGQLTRLLVIEAAILTTLALLSSWVGVRGLIGWLGPRYLTPPVTVDLRVALFSALVAAAVVLLSGLAPAWFVIRRATAQGLRETGVAPNAWLRNTLVVIQIAACLTLLAIGSLLMRSVQVSASKVEHLDRVLIARLNFDSRGYDVPRATTFLDALLERLRADTRFSGSGLASNCIVDTRPAGNTDRPWSRAECLEVTPGYFDAMAFAPLVGRTFNTIESGNVVILNESAARKLAPTGSPIGMAVLVRSYTPSTDAPAVHEVIGVIPDSYHSQQNSPEGSLARIYTPLRRPMPLYLSVMVRERDTVDLTAALRRTIASIDPVGPATWVNRATDAQDERTTAQRHLAIALGTLGVVALALAATGLFAVMAYAVSMRTREIGIRMALGAHPAVVQRLVLGQSLRLAGIGAVIGLAIAIPIAHAFRGAIFGVSPLDPVAVGLVTTLLVVTALAAGAVPAHRAAAIDPVKALRAE